MEHIPVVGDDRIQPIGKIIKKIRNAATLHLHVSICT